MAGPTTLRCPLCQRDCPRDMMTRHHLQTRKVDRFDIELVCSDCHKHIHAFFENRQVARELNSIDALLGNEEFCKALSFIRKQPPGSRTRVKTARRKRR
jgi:hypothetical protein